jgi:hypothetical protein
MFLSELTQFVKSGNWIVPDDLRQRERLMLPAAQLACKAPNKCWMAVIKHGRRLETLKDDERHSP